MGLRDDGPWPGLWPVFLSRLAIWFKINYRLPRAPGAHCLGAEAAAKAEAAARSMPPRKQMLRPCPFISHLPFLGPECRDLLPHCSRERRLCINLGRTIGLMEWAGKTWHCAGPRSRGGGGARNALFMPVSSRTWRGSVSWNTKRRVPR